MTRPVRAPYPTFRPRASVRIFRTAMIRIRAGISYALAEAMGDGHCGLPTTELARLAETLLEAPRAVAR